MEHSQPIRILHIITRMIVGGAQENTLLSVEGLNRLGQYEATLATGLETGPEGQLLTRARSTAPLVAVPDLCRNVNLPRDLRSLIHLYRIIRDGKYHIVHTHSAKAGVLGRIAARLAGTPIIVHTLHGMAFHDYQSWWVNRLWRIVMKACARFTDHFISVSEVMKEKAISAGIAGRGKFTTIFSGMELDWFLRAHVDSLAVRRELGIPDDALVVGKIARFFPLKGHEQLLAAAPAIVRRHPDVRFLLIGNGILYNDFCAKARALGILDHFVFTGLVDRENIPRMVAAMDILVHTSLREGLARALVQALAMGKPCVAFDLDGAPEVVISGKTGYLVQPGDPEGLSESISTLLGDPAMRRRMGEEGRRLIDPAFRAETMVDQIAGVYQILRVMHAQRLARFDAGARSHHRMRPALRRAGSS